MYPFYDTLCVCERATRWPTAAAGMRLRIAEPSDRGRVSMDLQVLCWRTVPVRNSQIGEVARSSEPFIRQAFVVDAADAFDEDDFKRRVFALRKRSTHVIPKPGRRFYICSLSHTIVVYKGQFTSDQLWAYFADLQVIPQRRSPHDRTLR